MTDPKPPISETANEALASLHETLGALAKTPEEMSALVERYNAATDDQKFIDAYTEVTDALREVAYSRAAADQSMEERGVPEEIKHIGHAFSYAVVGKVEFKLAAADVILAPLGKREPAKPATPAKTPAETTDAPKPKTKRFGRKKEK